MQDFKKVVVFFVTVFFCVNVQAEATVIKAGEGEANLLDELINRVGTANIILPEGMQKVYTYLDDASCRMLIETAKKARENAYAPYSKFKVGAAVLCESGKIYTGVNVENASFGLTVCAERNAIYNAVGQGESKIKAIAIALDDAAYGSPCGACRQVIREFGKDVDVVMGTLHGKYVVKKIAELLPLAFALDAD